MKALNNEVVVPTGFKPIAVTILIETQGEYDALYSANSNLTADQIYGGYTDDHRTVWVDVLDCIAEDMRRKSC
jgi:hypothetical protein